jgi:hypothetical protein
MQIFALLNACDSYSCSSIYGGSTIFIRGNQRLESLFCLHYHGYPFRNPKRSGICRLASYPWPEGFLRRSHSRRRRPPPCGSSLPAAKNGICPHGLMCGGWDSNTINCVQGMLQLLPYVNMRKVGYSSGRGGPNPLSPVPFLQLSNRSVSFRSSYNHSGKSVRRELPAIARSNDEARASNSGVAVTKNEEKKRHVIRASRNPNCTF